MAQEFPYPFNLPLQGIVDANGDLTVEFGPSNDVRWIVRQVSIKMPTAPAGALVELRYMSALVDAPASARRAAASDEPPISLQGGETMSVVWSGCTPGDVGEVFVVYEKASYT